MDEHINATPLKHLPKERIKNIERMDSGRRRFTVAQMNEKIKLKNLQKTYKIKPLDNSYDKKKVKKAKKINA